MGGIYIPDVSLPGDGDFELWIAVKKDGSFTYNVSGAWLVGNQKAVPVSPHGRLIDAGELRELYEEWENDKEAGIDIDKYHVPIPVIRQNIDDAPTIIPASEEVYDKYTDTAGNLHFTGTQSGKHIIRAQEGEA